MRQYQDYEMFDRKIRIVEENQKIVRVEALVGNAGCEQAADSQKDTESGRCESPLLRQAALELEEYFEGQRQSFDLPLAPVGTPFQQKVWKALREIPYGETASYGQIAAKVGSPRGARAVGMACNRNPILILIPCHRVIGADGSLTGFGGGLDMKEKLLGLERQSKTQGNRMAGGKSTEE